MCKSQSPVLPDTFRHLIEPRFDEFKSAGEKAAILAEMGGQHELSLEPFRAVLHSTPIIAAGGYSPDNYESSIAQGKCDMVAFGRYFTWVRALQRLYISRACKTDNLSRSNPDLVDRLREKKELYKWDRSRFYGPFPDNEIGYTVHMKREIAMAEDSQKAQLADWGSRYRPPLCFVQSAICMLSQAIVYPSTCVFTFSEPDRYFPGRTTSRECSLSFGQSRTVPYIDVWVHSYSTATETAKTQYLYGTGLREVQDEEAGELKLG
jgi:hypothetical protein